MDSWTFIAFVAGAGLAGFAAGLFMHDDETRAVWKLYEAMALRCRLAEEHVAALLRRMEATGSDHDD